MANKLTAVVLAKNEAANINRALKSVSFCDEILIIDDHSTDETAELSKKHHAQVFERELKGDFSAQRNFGLKESGGEWTLFIDADEEVTEELQKEIKEVLNLNSENIAYHIKRRDYFWGRELRYGETSQVRNKGLIRLMRRDSGKWVSPVHETFHTHGPVGLLRGFINHYPHPTIKEFLQSVNTYSTLRARELLDSGKRPNVFELVGYPFAKFWTNYLFKLGFLDGPAGFVYAFMMSFHSFLVRAKLYQYFHIDRKKS